MRALCGAIIAAGAMIGLGLTAVGFGVRYAMMDKLNPDTHAQIGATSLTILLTVLGCGLAMGSGPAGAYAQLISPHTKEDSDLVRRPGSRSTLGGSTAVSPSSWAAISSR